MKYPILFATLYGLYTLSAAAQAAPLPKGAIRAGSLANPKLIQDAKMGVAAKVATLGCSKPETLEPFVMAMPAGQVGSRRWRELWLVGGCGKRYPVTLDFSEDGPNAANWTIHRDR